MAGSPADRVRHSWRLTFLINVPIGIAAAFLRRPLFLESESTPRWLDLPGAVTGTLGLLGIVYGLTRAGDASHGWSDNATIALAGSPAPCSCSRSS